MFILPALYNSLSIYTFIIFLIISFILWLLPLVAYQLSLKNKTFQSYEFICTIFMQVIYLYLKNLVLYSNTYVLHLILSNIMSKIISLNSHRYQIWRQKLENIDINCDTIVAYMSVSYIMVCVLFIHNDI